jgi:hypothetical protein
MLPILIEETIQARQSQLYVIYCNCVSFILICLVSNILYNMTILQVVATLDWQEMARYATRVSA